MSEQESKAVKAHTRATPLVAVVLAVLGWMDSKKASEDVSVASHAEQVAASKATEEKIRTAVNDMRRVVQDQAEQIHALELVLMDMDERTAAMPDPAPTRKSVRRKLAEQQSARALENARKIPEAAMKQKPPTALILEKRGAADARREAEERRLQEEERAKREEAESRPAPPPPQPAPPPEKSE